MEKAVSGHGVFIYDAKQTIARYGSPQLIAQAISNCDMQHAWVRIHGMSQATAAEPTSSLIKVLKDSGIAVAGWGWCQGAQVEQEAEIALSALEKFHLEQYIADIEDGVNNAVWSTDSVQKFLRILRNSLPKAHIGVSTFGFINWHKPELVKVAEEYVDFFAPQVYWFNFPTLKMLNSVAANKADFPLNDPASYTRLCIKEWQKIVSKPLVVTGQVYWGEAPGFTQEKSEAKLNDFLDRFDNWKQLEGINWWHLGGKDQKAMSFSMLQAIKEAKLNEKFLLSNKF